MSFEKLFKEGAKIESVPEEIEAKLDVQKSRLNEEIDSKGYGELADKARKLLFIKESL